MRSSILSLLLLQAWSLAQGQLYSKRQVELTGGCKMQKFLAETVDHNSEHATSGLRLLFRRRVIAKFNVLRLLNIIITQLRVRCEDCYEC
jgi:hypothetical protein